ncbi:MAG: hypothetical protein HY788_19280 [Deltaproteobacteria bacterium]|nr:hypothetical protein [Deltaproteobacteria bacterium]
MASIPAESTVTLSVTVRPGSSGLFNPLLQSGFKVRAALGSTIETFLRERLGLDKEYVQNRIQTVFMNNKAVDDPAKATITEGAVLALSAALPGLVGATLRKGGYYAAMREGISYGAATTQASGGDTWVRVKLFNLVAKDLGAAFLERGMYVEGASLDDFFERQSPDFWSGCRRIELDGRALSAEELRRIIWKDRKAPVLLKVLQEG